MKDRTGRNAGEKVGVGPTLYMATDREGNPVAAAETRREIEELLGLPAGALAHLCMRKEGSRRASKKYGVTMELLSAPGWAH